MFILNLLDTLTTILQMMAFGLLFLLLFDAVHDMIVNRRKAKK